jgi:hypothetical protein
MGQQNAKTTLVYALMYCLKNHRASCPAGMGLVFPGVFALTYWKLDQILYAVIYS